MFNNDMKDSLLFLISLMGIPTIQAVTGTSNIWICISFILAACIIINNTKWKN